MKILRNGSSREHKLYSGVCTWRIYCI